MMTAVMEQVAVRQTVRRRPRWVLAGAGMLLMGAAFVYVLYVTVPKGNVGHGPVDALVVLGTPAGLHGELNPMQIWRVNEAIREYRAGRAPRVLFTGGPTANRFVEAEVMAAYARGQGLPSEVILTEDRSHTTMQNIANANEILRAHGWTSVEVISSAQHLPRAAVLLEKTGLRWRVHAAPTPGWSWDQIDSAYVDEAFGTAVLRIFGKRAEPVLHALAVMQAGTAWTVRWIVYRWEAWISR